jgi:hypothetical protein
MQKPQGPRKMREAPWATKEQREARRFALTLPETIC